MGKYYLFITSKEEQGDKVNGKNNDKISEFMIIDDSNIAANLPVILLSNYVYQLDESQYQKIKHLTYKDVKKMNKTDFFAENGFSELVI
jgi:hypothetical protein